MKYRTFSVASTVAVLLLGSSLTWAIENKTDSAQGAATKVDAAQKSTNSDVGAKHKQAAKIKPVDINSASKAELIKLPGIGAAEADKIIAGRPFGSKAWLVTNNIIPLATYQALKHKIVCNLTKKEAAQIEAQYAKNKK
jgi:competence protein ComEA